MATQTIPSEFRALLIPSPAHIFANMDLTSPPTQAGPLPGVPEDTSATRSQMVLQSSGTQSANGALRLQTVRGGFPGVHRVGGGYIWKGSADTYWRGRDVPSSISHSRAIGSTTSTYGFRYPSIIALANGKLVCAYAGGSSTTRTVVVRTRGTTLTWNSATTVHSEDNAGSGTSNGWLFPCLVELPDGRILLFHWTIDSTNSEAQVSCYFSDDEGDTWTRQSAGVLQDALSWSAGQNRRLRAAYSNGQIALFAWRVIGGTDRIWQWASSDFGGSFSLVRDWDSAGDAGLAPDVVGSPTGDGFIVGLTSGSTFKPVYARIGNAYEPVILSEMTAFSMTELSGVAGFGEGALAVADDGIVYWYLNYWPNTTYGGLTTYGGSFVLRSRDQGLTWEGMNYGETLDAAISETFGTWWMVPELYSWPREYSACYSRGQVVLAHNMETGGSGDQSLGELTLGGSSTVTMPRQYAHQQDTRQAWWRLNWIPYDEPDDMGWTLSTTGTAPSETVSAGNYYRVTSIAGATLTQTYTCGINVLCRFRAYASTGSYKIKVGQTSGANGYQCDITRSGTTLTVEDTGTSAYQIATTSSLPSGSTSVEVKFAITGDKVSVYWRSCASPATNQDREWTVLVEGGTLLLSVNDGNYIKMYVPASSTVSWEELHATWEEETGASFGYDLATNGRDDDELFPVNFSRRPVYVDDGVSVAAIDGPCIAGQTWSINTRYEHGLENLDPRISPSPRVPWRATGTAEENLVWDLDGEEHYFGSTSIGVYLANGNDRYYTVSTMLAGVVAEEVATIDAAAGQSGLYYLRRGDCIVVDPTQTSNATRYWPENSLVGCTVDLGGGKYRKVTRNTEGRWTNAATKRPTLWLDGVDGTEATSGTMAVWAKDVLWVWHAAFGKYDGLQVTVESGSNADGYHELGLCLAGPVVVFAQEYSWGRGLELEANVDVQTRRGGSRSASKLGPARRTVDFGWREGVDTTAMMGSQPSPDYLAATSSTGAVTYDFESGLPAGWSVGGDVGWGIAVDQVHGGAQALKSGAITHGQTSTATFDTDPLPLGGTLLVWRRVDSEVGPDPETQFDLFKIKLDGVEAYSRAGALTTWDTISLDLDPGVTTVEFSYTKDGSVSEGDDAAWIDDVTVTPTVDRALGVLASTPSLIEGLVFGIDGPLLPVVYLPRLVTSSDEVTLNQRDDHLYGRIMDAVRREAVLGDENVSEVQRVASIAISEEL